MSLVTANANAGTRADTALGDALAALATAIQAAADSPIADDLQLAHSYLSTRSTGADLGDVPSLIARAAKGAASAMADNRAAAQAARTAAQAARAEARKARGHARAIYIHVKHRSVLYYDSADTTGSRAVAEARAKARAAATAAAEAVAVSATSVSAAAAAKSCDAAVRTAVIRIDDLAHLLDNGDHHTAAPSAGRLLAVAVRLLPAGDRGRYAEEYSSELWEIAITGSSRRLQLQYATRQFIRVAHLRVAVRSPNHGKS